MPHTLFILFWATGDLAKRYLFPALSTISATENIDIIATGRRIFSESEFHDFLRVESLEYFSDEHTSSDFFSRLSYQKVDIDQLDAYDALRERMESLSDRDTQVVIYLSIASTLFDDFLLGYARLRSRFPHTRIVLEKPFGADLESARSLHHSLTPLFPEEQIYRIDHYVAKWWIQNILALRFANIFFEPIWNHHYIDNIQITVSESLSVGNRGAYYETAGALRDMVQNHLFQMLALILMRRPDDLTAESIRQAKTEILKSLSIRNIREDVIFGQYAGYLKEKDVAADSRMETFVAMRLESNAPQYEGIPFYLRTGKCLSKKETSIVIEFQKSQYLGFENADTPNRIIINIQSDETIEIHFFTRSPLGEHALRRTISSTEKIPPSKNAYQKLLEDVIAWDHTLFISWDMLEATWELIDALIHCKDDCPIIFPYVALSRGPDAMDALLEADGRNWYEREK